MHLVLHSWSTFFFLHFWDLFIYFFIYCCICVHVHTYRTAHVWRIDGNWQESFVYVHCVGHGDGNQVNTLGGGHLCQPSQHQSSRGSSTLLSAVAVPCPSLTTVFERASFFSPSSVAFVVCSRTAVLAEAMVSLWVWVETSSVFRSRHSSDGEVLPTLPSPPSPSRHTLR